MPISSSEGLVGGGTRLARGDNQVNMHLLWVYQEFQVTANNNMVPGLEMGALSTYDFWPREIYIIFTRNIVYINIHNSLSSLSKRTEELF